ncbi:MAG: carbohydrate kinase family protein [Sedimentisphaerales bacterium]
MMDILILNTAVVDIRSSEFDFVKTKVKQGGLVKCQYEELPGYKNEDYLRWIEQGNAHAGGPGNCAPLMARTGLKVSVGVNLGLGQYKGFDVLGHFFYDTMLDNNVDVSAVQVHPLLPTAVTFIYEDKNITERGGIVYFPNANDDFNLESFVPIVRKLRPKIVYYMYVGESKRADANEGKDLRNFLKYCQQEGAVTIVDSATFAEDPQKAIKSSQIVQEYKLLDNILENVDIFFTSYDEARIIRNSLFVAHGFTDSDADDILIRLNERYNKGKRARLFGITVKDGAFVLYSGHNKIIHKPSKITSNYLTNGVVELVGAGDAFRAGVLTYICHNLQAFQNGTFDYRLAVQMGNLFASKYIQSPLSDRYRNIHSYDRMLKELCA